MASLSSLALKTLTWTAVLDLVCRCSERTLDVVVQRGHWMLSFREDIGCCRSERTLDVVVQRTFDVVIKR
jgi:hypothetical protein